MNNLKVVLLLCGTILITSLVWLGTLSPKEGVNYEAVVFLEQIDQNIIRFKKKCQILPAFIGEPYLFEKYEPECELKKVKDFEEDRYNFQYEPYGDNYSLKVCMKLTIELKDKNSRNTFEKCK